MAEDSPLKQLFGLIEAHDVPSLTTFCANFSEFDQTDDTNYFPLHFAVKNGFLDVVKLLLDHDADINFNFRETALMAAVKYNFPEITEFLIEKGADITALNDENIIFYSIRNNDLELTKKLIEKHRAPFNLVSAKHETPLHLAIQQESLDFVNFLLEKGANPNIPGYACISLANKQGNKEIASILEKNGAFEDNLSKPPVIKIFSPRPYNPFTPLDMLFQIIRLRNIPGLRQFCQTYKNFEQIDEKNIYPLHFAVECGFLDIVKIMIENGADVNFNHKETCLMAAVKYQKKDIIDFLLENKDIDFSSLNENNENVLFYSIRNNDFELTKTLVTQKSVPVNVVSHKNESPLLVSIFQKNIEIVKLLLENSANPNAQGVPCLKTAGNTRNPNIVELLVSFGAKEEVRAPRVSRKKFEINQKRIQKIEERSPKRSLRSKDGVCVYCQKTEGLLKLIPCGHAVICQECVRKLPDIIQKCPVCGMCYMATTSV